MDENRIVIRVPYNKPDSEIDNIIRRKGRWIIKKKREYDEAKNQIKMPSFEIGSTLPYMGRNYQIARGSYSSNEYLELRRGRFLVSGNNISGMYKKWLMQKSHTIYPRKFIESPQSCN